MASDPYIDIAGHLPNRVGVGGALITMVEPDPGFEHAYNRWYEDDHFYSGAMVGPWMFSGRRWVATHDLLSLRFPNDSPIAQPVTAGCYISTYLMLEGHYEDAVRWGQVTMRDHLYPSGRGFDQRQHIYTAFSTYEFGAVRDDLPFLQPHHVMDHPFLGMAVEVYEPVAEGGQTDMRRRLQEALPPELAESPVAAALAFTPHPQTDSGPVPRVGSAPGAGRNVTVLWFLQADPRACWSKFRQHDKLAAGVGGRLVFAAPFIPTIPGTDTYVAELR